MGPRPTRSPSLSGYPKCDDQLRIAGGWALGRLQRHVDQVARAWAMDACSGDVAPESILADSGIRPDFTSQANLRSIHRKQGDRDIYFVSNPQPGELKAVCWFRVTSKSPSSGGPTRGESSPPQSFVEKERSTRPCSLPLGPSGSVFVVFRQEQTKRPLRSQASGDGRRLSATTVGARPRRSYSESRLRSARRSSRTARRAGQGAEDGECGRRPLPGPGSPPAMIRPSMWSRPRSSISRSTATARPGPTDQETVVLASVPASEHLAELHRDPAGQLLLEAWKPGDPDRGVLGKKSAMRSSSLPDPLDLSGPWDVAFTPHWGAPEKATFDRLMSWTDHSDPGVKFYSGMQPTRRHSPCLRSCSIRDIGST